MSNKNLREGDFC